jgi:hypothetical protein
VDAVWDERIKEGSSMFFLNRLCLGPALILTCVLVALCACCPRAQARILRVSPDGNGSGGESWATAYPLISTAIASATSGDTIWVRQGSYDDNVLIEKRLTLLGGFEGDEGDELVSQRNPSLYITTIDAVGRELAPIICGVSSEIDGFVVKGARNRPGLALYESSIQIRNCVITNNQAWSSGGGCLITNAKVDFCNCSIASNTANSSGGGVSSNNSSVSFSNCTITSNIATGGSGGGIGTRDGSTLIMWNCVIHDNVATSVGIPYIGGGITNSHSKLLLNNCIFYRNGNQYTHGSDIATGGEGSETIISNCTFISKKEGVAWSEIPPILKNCILWGNNEIFFDFGPSIGYPPSAKQPDISYSCIQGGYPGLGNISDDPLLRNAAAGDFRLLPESPCIDTAGTSGPSDDLNGNPRPVDIASIGREVTDTYDMGAYEFQVDELPKPASVRDWGLFE